VQNLVVQDGTGEGGCDSGGEASGYKSVRKRCDAGVCGRWRGPMQDDSYDGDAEGQDRGMEEETAVLVADADKTEEAAADKDEGRQVNLFA
jgi:hypothetical protein